MPGATCSCCHRELTDDLRKDTSYDVYTALQDNGNIGVVTVIHGLPKKTPTRRATRVAQIYVKFGTCVRPNEQMDSIDA